MLNIDNEVRQFIEKNFDNSEELLNAKNINDILDPLYFLIEQNGFDEKEAYNNFGREAQEIYNKLYYDN